MFDEISVGHSLPSFLLSSRSVLGEYANIISYSYKGMSSPAPGSGSQSPRSMSVSPQSTGGFSQIHGRNLGEGGGGQQMSVLLSWNEKLVEVAGIGSIVRVMTDRRTV